AFWILAGLAMLAAAGGRLLVSEWSKQANISREAIKRLANRGAIQLVDQPLERSPFMGAAEPVKEISLTAAQAVALRAICEGQPKETFLLHGVTGSGKTEVYLRAVATELARGRGAIILVPEISLAAQVIACFHSYFGQKLAILHSKLSEGERYSEWCRIRSGEAQLVVGARSAIFAPVDPLGLIIIDEEHEPAYKQEQAPRYHARAVALQRADLEGARVVLGSATPSLESYQAAKRGRFRLLTLPDRVRDLPLPAVRLIDMRLEARDGNKGPFSRSLIAALTAVLASGEQAIILLNRRGYAPFVLCRNCGAVAQCPYCSVALTYHRDWKALCCHYCGTKRAPTECCQHCGGHNVRYLGAGTEKVVESLGKLFPGVRVLRLDRDSTTRKGAHHQIISTFVRGEADILVGTQMVAKGFDFPHVRLVGILATDATLRLPDFRSTERTFQLVTQAAGRAGRASAGLVIVQTFAPDHPALVAASAHDYQAFASLELPGREALAYPPFGRIIAVTIAAANYERAWQLANELKQRLADIPAEILGPAPALLTLLNGQHRIQIIIKTKRLNQTSNALRQALTPYLGLSAVHFVVDVDAISLS
ncbi:MAG: primosomal protein N', partial [Cyanobacteria bacterium NC_groundwater_1444_Ag_S-0.65um_54_12]|nr:primosomal protein N' [Cyanobacteria bacterium NC_groundwater_1444_Ag_S-0.65um_54_12]